MSADSSTMDPSRPYVLKGSARRSVRSALLQIGRRLLREVCQLPSRLLDGSSLHSTSRHFTLQHCSSPASLSAQFLAIPMPAITEVVPVRFSDPSRLLPPQHVSDYLDCLRNSAPKLVTVKPVAPVYTFSAQQPSKRQLKVNLNKLLSHWQTYARELGDAGRSRDAWARHINSALERTVCRELHKYGKTFFDRYNTERIQLRNDLLESDAIRQSTMGRLQRAKNALIRPEVDIKCIQKLLNARGSRNGINASSAHPQYRSEPAFDREKARYASDLLRMSAVSPHELVKVLYEEYGDLLQPERLVEYSSTEDRLIGRRISGVAFRKHAYGQLVENCSERLEAKLRKPISSVDASSSQRLRKSPRRVGCAADPPANGKSMDAGCRVPQG